MAQLTLEYWTDHGWYVGRLKEVPSVLSQARTLAQLQRNIRSAYRLVASDRPATPKPAKRKPIRLTA